MATMDLQLLCQAERASSVQGQPLSPACNAVTALHAHQHLPVPAGASATGGYFAAAKGEMPLSLSEVWVLLLKQQDLVPGQLPPDVQHIRTLPVLSRCMVQRMAVLRQQTLRQRYGSMPAEGATVLEDLESELGVLCGLLLDAVQPHKQVRLWPALRLCCCLRNGAQRRSGTAWRDMQAESCMLGGLLLCASLNNTRRAVAPGPRLTRDPSSACCQV